MTSVTHPGAPPRRERAVRSDAEADRARLEAEAARADAERARAREESARRRFALLSEAGRILGGSLDYETTLRNVAGLAVPQLADCCAVDLLEPGGVIRRVAVADVDAERERLLWEIGAPRRFDAEPVPSHVEAILAGRSQWFSKVGGEPCLAVATRDRGIDAVRRLLGFRSFLSVPLPVHGQILGSISIARSASPAAYGASDLALLEELAQRAGLAVDHARLYRNAREANRVKEEFLATLGHELRSPLTSALLCAQMLRRGILDPTASARALATIERKIQAEARLVDDLLDLSRIASGKLFVAMEPVGLTAIVHAAVDEARPVAELAGVELRSRTPDVAATVRGDASRLQQVLGNLLSNAIKFSGRGGAVEVSLEVAGTEARIHVRDSGIGISAELLPRIFDRFRQADTALTRAQGGLGLGLTIVRHLVELHGGTIRAQSEGEGRGATLTVALALWRPGFDAPAGIAARPPAAAAPDLEGVRVVVVEDEADAREAMVAALAACGAVISAAASVEEGLALFRSAPRDVLVSDIAMPGTDGHALPRMLRDAGVDVPAIAVTAHATASDRARVLAAGYRLHLTKPVAFQALAAAVAAVAAGRNAGRTGRLKTS